jgi:hypothetical protein
VNIHHKPFPDECINQFGRVFLFDPQSRPDVLPGLRLDVLRQPVMIGSRWRGSRTELTFDALDGTDADTVPRCDLANAGITLCQSFADLALSCGGN